MRRLASIDIGSQTIRLLVADVTPEGRLLPVFKNHAIIRLGEGMNANGYLKNESIKRAVSCIADFTEQAQKMHPASIYAVATACVRTAKNCADFLSAVFNNTGIMPTVITGQEEALIALAGVGSVLNIENEPMIVIDIGGGSTELIYVHRDKILEIKSIPMGVIGCTELYLVNDPPLTSDISLLRHGIETIIAKHVPFEDTSKTYKVLAGTAGTITTLAAMDLCMTEYDSAEINGHTLSLQCIKKLFDEMLRKNIAQRSSMAGLQSGLAKVIIAGTAIVLEIMKVLERETLLVSDAGLLEGILIQKIKSLSL